MNVDDFHGFHFLPPSIHLPPNLRPVHGTVTEMPGVVIPLTSDGAVARHVFAADHVLPLADEQG